MLNCFSVTTPLKLDITAFQAPCPTTPITWPLCTVKVTHSKFSFHLYNCCKETCYFDGCFHPHKSWNFYVNSIITEFIYNLIFQPDHSSGGYNMKDWTSFDLDPEVQERLIKNKLRAATWAKGNKLTFFYWLHAPSLWSRCFGGGGVLLLDIRLTGMCISKDR